MHLLDDQFLTMCMNKIKRHKEERDKKAFTLKREQNYASNQIEEVVFKRFRVTRVLPKIKIKSFISFERSLTRVSSIQTATFYKIVKQITKKHYSLVFIVWILNKKKISIRYLYFISKRKHVNL